MVNNLWLVVVWNIFTFSIYWECHNPNWRPHIFQRGRYTTNQLKVCWIQNCFWVALCEEKLHGLLGNPQVTDDFPIHIGIFSAISQQDMSDCQRVDHIQSRMLLSNVQKNIWGKFRLKFEYLWVNLIMTSLFSLTGIMVKIRKIIPFYGLKLQVSETS